MPCLALGLGCEKGGREEQPEGGSAGITRIPGSGNSTHVKARSGRKEISLAGIGLVKERMSSDRLGVVDRGLCLCNNVRDFRSLRARESHGRQNNIHGK